MKRVLLAALQGRYTDNWEVILDEESRSVRDKCDWMLAPT